MRKPKYKAPPLPSAEERKRILTLPPMTVRVIERKTWGGVNTGREDIPVEGQRTHPSYVAEDPWASTVSGYLEDYL